MKAVKPKYYLMDQSGAHSHRGRILLFAGPSSTGMHYYYADELPRYILLFKVLTVLCFVFTTPHFSALLPPHHIYREEGVACS